MRETLTHDLFEPLVGTGFHVQADNVDLVLTLVKVEPAGTERDGFQPFALLFEGPSQPALQQQIVPLRHTELGEVAIFLTLLGEEDGGVTYEAIFN